MMGEKARHHSQQGAIAAAIFAYERNDRRVRADIR
jgi:hypothetical protein